MFVFFVLFIVGCDNVLVFNLSLSRSPKLQYVTQYLYLLSSAAAHDNTTNNNQKCLTQ